VNEPRVTAAAAGAAADGAGGGVAASARAWWRGLAARERRLLALGGTVLLVAAVWAVAVLPAWRTLQRAPPEIERLDAQLQDMRALATETQQLRAMPPVSQEQAAAVLKSAADRLGAKAKLSLQGERAVLTLAGLEPGQLTSWLAEVRSGARVRPLEANLTRAGAGFSGTLVLGLGTTP